MSSNLSRTVEFTPGTSNNTLLSSNFETCMALLICSLKCKELLNESLVQLLFFHETFDRKMLF